MKRMKCLIVGLLSVLIAVNFLAVPAMAADDAEGYVIHYEDGSYATVTFFGDTLTRSIAEKSKTYIYYNSQNQRCFAYTLCATFTYDGATSRADSCDYAAVIYRQGWDMGSHSEYVSGNTAYGRATFTGPDGQIRTASLTLACDKNGNVV